MNILLDMDGVLTNLEGSFWTIWESQGRTPIPQDERKNFYVTGDMHTEEERREANRILQAPGFYANLVPMTGAIHGAHLLLHAGHDVRICTKPMPGAQTCPSEKTFWVKRWLGECWVRRLIITSDKTCVRGDVLIDDAVTVDGHYRPEWRHIIFDWPYNNPRTSAVDVDSNRERVYHWDDICRKFVRDVAA